jgi:hypothetical protein
LLVQLIVTNDCFADSRQILCRDSF